MAGGARIALLPPRRLDQSAGGCVDGVAAGFSFVLWVMPAARPSREHSKKSTLSGRIRLREKCLHVKFPELRQTSADPGCPQFSRYRG